MRKWNAELQEEARLACFVAEAKISPIPQGKRKSSLTFSPSFVSGIDPIFMAACPNEGTCPEQELLAVHCGWVRC